MGSRESKRNSNDFEPLDRSADSDRDDQEETERRSEMVPTPERSRNNHIDLLDLSGDSDSGANHEEMEEKLREIGEWWMEWSMKKSLRTMKEKMEREMEERLKEMKKKQLRFEILIWRRKEIKKQLKEMEKTERSEIQEILEVTEKELRLQMEKQMRKMESMNLEEMRSIIERLKENIQEYENEKLLIENLIRELNGIADELDGVDRKATIAKTAGSSVGIVGGILGIVGLALAPFTFGATTALSIAGTVVSAAGGVTSVGAGIGKFADDKKYNKRVEEKVKEIKSIIEDLGKSCNDAISPSSCHTENAAAFLKGILKPRDAADAVGKASTAVGVVGGVTGCVRFGFRTAVGLVDDVAGVAAHTAVGLVDDVAGVAARTAVGLVDDVAGVAARTAVGLVDDVAGVAARTAVGLVDDVAGVAARTTVGLVDDVAAAGARAAVGVVDDVAPAVVKSLGIVGGVVAGVCVILDAVYIGLNSKKLHEGLPTERAQEIRKVVENFEAALAEMNKFYSDIKRILKI
ncbi:uncharacterized protein LOC131702703 isoform X2 [Acipenser ruthenus]|uniref:uncharacterized protein LOC131702703 isoform X2 n=1 Tax=Acipenser ruthenus TaxID=7906 RepID=UPI002740B16E|nr:uncharacterized protein LOC131702703 isoform X2 [Acipenser ruthenus]